MEDIVGYVILISVGLGLLYAYQYRRIKVRQLPLSFQIYPEVDLKVFIHKQHGKTSSILFRIIAKKDLIITNLIVELITKKRSFEYFQIKEMVQIPVLPLKLESMKYLDIAIPFEKFKSHITQKNISFKTLRLVAEIGEGNKKFKTHELAFNKNWVIFRPDSGKYN